MDEKLATIIKKMFDQYENMRDGYQDALDQIYDEWGTATTKRRQAPKLKLTVEEYQLVEEATNERL